ncbi:MAG TPA: hypothetical protein DEZ27_05970 [Sphaerochaeta sp.]|nr:hypothetical protein [Sphaerochaeta sp.]
MTIWKKIVGQGIALFLTMHQGCKEKGVEPPLPLKNPREYTWTIDTLAYPGSYQTNTRDIYGSDAHNLWTVGYNDRSGGKMYRFDGKQWADVKLYTSQGGKIIPGINLNAIHGFSARDIWAVGERHYTSRNPPPTFLDSSLIIHFDGQEWTESAIDRGGELKAIWGSGPGNIWAAGTNTLYHFDGARWEKFPILIPSQGMQFGSIAGTGPSEVYMVGYLNDVVPPQDSLADFLYRFDGNHWVITDSNIVTVGSPPVDRFGSKLYVIEGMVFSVGYGVYKKSGDRWDNLIYTSWRLTRLRGTSIQNLFAVGIESQVYHYNGSDWYRYPQFNGLDKWFTSVWTYRDEVFVVGFTVDYPQKTVVLHGK